MRSSLEGRLQQIARRLLIAAAVACCVAFVFATWQRFPSLIGYAAWRDFLIAYALPLLGLAAVLAACARRPHANYLLVLITLVSGLSSLFAGELYLQYQSYGPRDRAARAAARRLRVAFDSRPKASVVRDLRSQGLRAFPFVRIISDPKFVTIGTIPNAHVIDCNEFGPWFVPQTDRYGLVNPDTMWGDGQSVDVVLVGDSFAMGECDPITGGIAGVLRASGYRVLNLGMAGNDPLLNLASLAELGAGVRAGVVLWLHFAGNDLDELKLRAEHPILRRYVSDSRFKQLIPLRMNEVERRLRALESQALEFQKTFFSSVFSPKGFAKTARLYAVRTTLGLVQRIHDPDVFELFGRVLHRADDLAHAMGAQLIVASIPAVGQVGAETVDDIRTERAATSINIRFINLEPTLRKISDYRTLYSQEYMGHFAPRGNKVVANQLIERLFSSR